jgi:hypothetical protein
VLFGPAQFAGATFGRNGIATTALPGVLSARILRPTTVPPDGRYPGRLLLQSNGRILVVGTTRQEIAAFALLRYLD